MTWPTCTHDIGNGDQYVPCGVDARWKVWFSDGWERTTTEVCDAHLVDEQEHDDYRGATAL